jgi:hypothetical protein
MLDECRRIVLMHPTPFATLVRGVPATRSQNCPKTSKTMPQAACFKPISIKMLEKTIGCERWGGPGLEPVPTESALPGRTLLQKDRSNLSPKH